MLKKILVAIDGTEYSWRALEYAAGMAKIANAELLVLTVVKDGLANGVIGEANSGSIMQIGNEVLDVAKHIIDEQGLVCDYMLSMGVTPAEEIVKCCQREECDTIVIGTRGFGGFKGLIKNSVSRLVIEGSSVPVIVVK